MTPQLHLQYSAHIKCN